MYIETLVSALKRLLSVTCDTTLVQQYPLRIAVNTIIMVLFCYAKETGFFYSNFGIY